MGVEVQRDPLPADLVDRIAATPGVDRSARSPPAPRSCRPTAPPIEPTGPTLLGTWAEAPFTAYALRAGHAPHGSGEVVLDAATARAYDVSLGDTVTVSATASRQLRVVGLTGIGDGDGLANSTVVLVDLTTAQRLLGLGAGVSSVDVIAADGLAVPTCAPSWPQHWERTTPSAAARTPPRPAPTPRRRASATCGSCCSPWPRPGWWWARSSSPTPSASC